MAAGGFISVDDTTKYYQENFDMYRKVWGGTNDRMCWGYFDTMHNDIQLAGDRHVERMAALTGLTKDSNVLDIGCGKGTSIFYIQDTFNPTTVSLDPVKEFIDVANAKKAEKGYDKATFLCGTLHDLDKDLPDGSFTHVWSNAVFGHIPEQARQETLQILFRKLAPGGSITFDDMVCRQVEDSELIRKNILERLHLDCLWTFDKYYTQLESCGFKLIAHEDLTGHMEQTYRTTSKNATTHNFAEVAEMHTETANACARGSMGWGTFRATKVE